MKTTKKDTTKFNKSIARDNSGIYEIKIKGLLDDHWKQWFEGMTLKHAKNHEPEECTVITGPIADQPALHGLLEKIRDLNLTLISVRKMDTVTSGNRHRKTPSNQQYRIIGKPVANAGTNDIDDKENTT